MGSTFALHAEKGIAVTPIGTICESNGIFCVHGVTAGEHADAVPGMSMVETIASKVERSRSCFMASTSCKPRAHAAPRMIALFFPVFRMHDTTIIGSRLQRVAPATGRRSESAHALVARDGPRSTASPGDRLAGGAGDMMNRMRLALSLVCVACCLGGVVVACGGKHPPLATEGPDPTVGGDGDDGGAADGAVVDAGPAAEFCLDVPEGGVSARCNCSLSNGMITAEVACGFGLCVSYSTTVQICGYDGKLKIVPNVPFSVCTAEAGIPPCTKAGASDAGAGDADGTNDGG